MEESFGYGGGGGGGKEPDPRVCGDRLCSEIPGGRDAWENKETVPFTIKNQPSMASPSLKSQIQDGIAFFSCNDGFELIRKSSDNSPACVKHYTAERLVLRGWAKDIVNPLLTTIDVTFSEKDHDSHIDKSEITVYQNINSTIVFHNNLNQDITISQLNKENSTILFSDDPYEIVIPKNYSKQIISFKSHQDKERKSYNQLSMEENILQYEVKPYNLKGTIILKFAPVCMTKELAQDLQSTMHGTFSLPTYVPIGYERTDCITPNFPSMFSYSYVNDNSTIAFNHFDTNYMIASSGGIQITYVNQLDLDTLNSVSQIKHSSCQETIQEKENAFCIDDYAISSWQAGGPNVGLGKAFNVTTVLNNYEGYNISGILPHEELIKIAKSLIISE